MPSLNILSLLLLLILNRPKPTSQISDFEASQDAIQSATYKSMACWYGSCETETEHTITLTSTPLPTSPYIPSPTPTPTSPTHIPSYIKKMSSPTEGVENVVYYDEGLNEIIYEDPNGVYASGFNVRLSIGQATVQDDNLGKWVTYDLVLGGELTKELKYGSVDFEGLTLNIPGTLVYFKVEATNAEFGLSTTNTQYLAVTELKSEIDEIIASHAAAPPQELPDISNYNSELNQITADASLSVSAKKGEVSLVSSGSTHQHFDGTFVVVDYYEDNKCEGNSLYYEYIKKDQCIAMPGGNSSKIVKEYTSIQVTTDVYKGVSDCRMKPANSTELGDNKETILETRNQCLQVDGGTTYKKIRAVKNSIADSGVCEGPKPVVRVSEWFGSDGLGKCHGNAADTQPTIRLFEIGKCHKVKGKTESFIFTGCYHGNSGLLTQFLGNNNCEGVGRNQREWGGSDENACFVGSVEGWGVQGGEDIAVQCGITCTS